jgi:polysaccharide biosynthesis/export protein
LEFSSASRKLSIAASQISVENEAARKILNSTQHDPGSPGCARLPINPKFHLRLVMVFGRFGLARSGSLFELGLLLFVSGVAQGQQAPTNPAQMSVTAIPAQPISEAAKGSAPRSAPAINSSSTSSSASITATADTRETSSLLKLAIGDLVEVGVYNVPELSTKARVGTSGDIYLPLIDYVHVADLTVEEAQTLIQKRLEDGGFVRNAHVTIFVDESVSQGVTILGEVARPGIYPALGDRKLYDLISAAGGFTPAAGRKVSVIRQHNTAPPITVNLARNLADDMEDDIEIMPGDTITVPRAPIIYVVGDVGHPTGLLIDNGSLTVLQALALAGGTNHTAKMSGTRIIRKGSSGMTETRVPLKKMLEAKAPDITLQADDILFVPLSGARVAGAQAVSAAISAATGIAVIAAHP